MAEITKIQLKTKLTRDDYVYLYNEDGDLWQCLDDIHYTAASNIKYIESPAIINSSIRLNLTESSLASLEILSSNAIGYKNSYSRDSFDLKQEDGSYTQNASTADLNIDNYPTYIISPLTFADDTIDVCIKIENKNSANNYPFEIYSVASTLSTGGTLNNFPLPEVSLDRGEALVDTNTKSVIVSTKEDGKAAGDDAEAIILGASKNVISDSSTGIDDAAATTTNSTLYLNHIDNEVRSSHKIEVDGAKLIKTSSGLKLDATNLVDNTGITTSSDTSLNITSKGVKVTPHDSDENLVSAMVTLNLHTLPDVCNGKSTTDLIEYFKTAYGYPFNITFAQSKYKSGIDGEGKDVYSFKIIDIPEGYGQVTLTYQADSSIVGWFVAHGGSIYKYQDHKDWHDAGKLTGSVTSNQHIQGWHQIDRMTNIVNIDAYTEGISTIFKVMEGTIDKSTSNTFTMLIQYPWQGGTSTTFGNSGIFSFSIYRAPDETFRVNYFSWITRGYKIPADSVRLDLTITDSDPKVYKWTLYVEIPKHSWAKAYISILDYHASADSPSNDISNMNFRFLDDDNASNKCSAFPETADRPSDYNKIPKLINIPYTTLSIDLADINYLRCIPDGTYYINSIEVNTSSPPDLPSSSKVYNCPPRKHLVGTNSSTTLDSCAALLTLRKDDAHRVYLTFTYCEGVTVHIKQVEADAGEAPTISATTNQTSNIFSRTLYTYTADGWQSTRDTGWKRYLFTNSEDELEIGTLNAQDRSSGLRARVTNYDSTENKYTKAYETTLLSQDGTTDLYRVKFKQGVDSTNTTGFTPSLQLPRMSGYSSSSNGAATIHQLPYITRTVLSLDQYIEKYGDQSSGLGNYTPDDINKGIEYYFFGDPSSQTYGSTYVPAKIWFKPYSWYFNGTWKTLDCKYLIRDTEGQFNGVLYVRFRNNASNEVSDCCLEWKEVSGTAVPSVYLCTRSYSKTVADKISYFRAVHLFIQSSNSRSLNIIPLSTYRSPEIKEETCNCYMGTFSGLDKPLTDADGFLDPNQMTKIDTLGTNVKLPDNATSPYIFIDKERLANIDLSTIFNKSTDNIYSLEGSTVNLMNNVEFKYTSNALKITVR